MGKIIACLLLLLSFSLEARNNQYQNTLEEVRIALMDVRKDFSEQKIELELLKEQLAKLQSNEKLQKRIDEIEKTQNKIVTDLRQLSGFTTQASNSLAVLEKQVHEVTKLKGTLTSISKAIGSNSPIHQVSSGESLEKIARKYNTTVSDLKRINGLTSNTIIIGQNLKIPQ
ncbi:MAG: LysM peptidoglycan-binding domain-containing protein [Simkaniaceae bacterium]|nr:LysM peptidoglycan-binding domain-containing protein [Candidatus Sacchlamyda saccharinae]